MATEAEVRKYFENEGFLVVRSGWPDFFIVDKKKDFAFMIEVKAVHDKLSKEQKATHKWLKHFFGIEIRVVRKLSDIKNIIGTKTNQYICYKYFPSTDDFKTKIKRIRPS